MFEQRIKATVVYTGVQKSYIDWAKTNFRGRYQLKQNKMWIRSWVQFTIHVYSLITS